MNEPDPIDWAKQKDEQRKRLEDLVQSLNKRIGDHVHLLLVTRGKFGGSFSWEIEFRDPRPEAALVPPWHTLWLSHSFSANEAIARLNDILLGIKLPMLVMTWKDGDV